MILRRGRRLKDAEFWSGSVLPGMDGGGGAIGGLMAQQSRTDPETPMAAGR